MMSSVGYGERKSPIKPFASSIRGKKNKQGDANSRLLQSIGQVKESTLKDLDNDTLHKLARRGTEVKKKKSTLAAS